MGKLRDRMKEDLILKAYSPLTRDGYSGVHSILPSIPCVPRRTTNQAWTLLPPENLLQLHEDRLRCNSPKPLCYTDAPEAVPPGEAESLEHSLQGNNLTRSSSEQRKSEIVSS